MAEPNLLRQRKNEREVTDPVTHLPLVVHDHVELDEVPSHPTKTQDGLSPEHHNEHSPVDSHVRHVSLERVLDEELRRGRWRLPGDSEVESKTKIQTAIVATIVTAAGGPAGLVALWVWSKFLGRPGFGMLELFAGVSGSLVLALMVGICVLFLPLSTLLQFFRKEIQSRLKVSIDIGIESDHTDTIQSPEADAVPSQQVDTLQSLRPPFQSLYQSPETAVWLNSLLHSLWPIVNPALFTSISDMLEDALQASLSSFVHGVHVADISQGSEPMRILGIRWLDSGNLQGDIFNLEVAVAYRARTVQRQKGKRLRDLAKNAHLLVEFLVPAGVVIPVWVELTGLLATARLRIQLMPNPPFFALCTLTLLGQPKTTIACTPLAKNFLNVMNIPVLSDWLQKIIDGVISEYVAPRSLTLDLKTMLMGQEKKDTLTEGVLVVTVRSAKGFSNGDGGNIFATKAGKKGDTYVQVGWGKWGKPLWSTRIVKGDSHPVWEETTVLLVGPTEINARELLRLQLWDSDLFTADDCLGTIDFPLKDIMSNSLKCFSAREDRFTGMHDKPRPGTLLWEVGYFPKTTLDDVKGFVQKVEQVTEKELQETKTRSPKTEQSSEETQGMSPPKEVWPSGILNIRIEKIEGLAIQKVRKGGNGEGGEDDDTGDLPSPYCTVIINHQRVYKTRTKMKSNNPFYNSSIEKFIRDWRSTFIMISVHDARIHEAHPLLGVVVLPLQTLFTDRGTSHLSESFPLVGGTGYGRMQLSLTFRSVQLQLHPHLLGWETGTLEIEPHVRASLDLSPDLACCQLVFRTRNGREKMDAHTDGGWRPYGKAHNVRVAVTRRYASCLVIEFQKQKHKAMMGIMSDRTPAFAVLWLKDVSDNEDVEVSLVVRKNVHGALARAEANCTDVGDTVGEIMVKLRLRPGLSGCHQEVADKDVHVLEVLRCVVESGEVKESDALFDNGEDSDGSLKRTDMETRKKGELHRKHPSLIDKMGAKITGTFEHHEHDFTFEKEI
ncbi:Meiotically up-regulated gene 190 protein [Termitomyces sp. T112]|nr:Meiotically up-regulated gene 190 protein [Termitomyces sp. T112]